MKRLLLKREQRTRQSGGGGDDGGDGIPPSLPLPLPPLPDSALMKNARRLNFTALAGRTYGKHTWPFPMVQWHRLLWFLAKVRVIDPPHDGYGA